MHYDTCTRSSVPNAETVVNVEHICKTIYNKGCSAVKDIAFEAGLAEGQVQYYVRKKYFSVDSILRRRAKIGLRNVYSLPGDEPVIQDEVVKKQVDFIKGFTDECTCFRELAEVTGYDQGLLKGYFNKGYFCFDNPGPCFLEGDFSRSALRLEQISDIESAYWKGASSVSEISDLTGINSKRIIDFYREKVLPSCSDLFFKGKAISRTVAPVVGAIRQYLSDNSHERFSSFDFASLLDVPIGKINRLIGKGYFDEYDVVISKEPIYVAK